ncbi:hypothetical protein HDU79_004704 [Rhizoclosmatium sp. JEL0117]|nr:hypothetical protein HDU79_004704 [Rhizoclosmatium sp. JEL0117]
MTFSHASPKLQHAIATLTSLATTSSSLKCGRHAAALLTRKGTIVSLGVSHHTSQTTTIHAETHCLNNYTSNPSTNTRPRRRRDLRKLDLLVVRVNPNGSELLNSEPCSDCVHALRACSFLRRVYYTARLASVAEAALTSGCFEQRVKEAKSRKLCGQELYRERRVCTRTTCDLGTGCGACFDYGLVGEQSCRVDLLSSF